MCRLQARLVEHPLDGGVQQDRVVEGGNFAVEPQVNARDGRVLELAELRGQLSAAFVLRQRGQQRGHGFEGQGDDHTVRRTDSAGSVHFPSVPRGADSVDTGAQANFSTALADVLNRLVIKLAERNGGNAHATAFRRKQKGFAENFGRVMDGDAVEVFIESAHEDGLPEAVDGALCLAMTMQPRGEILRSVGRKAAQKVGQAARDGKLVAQGECRRPQKRQRGMERGGQPAGPDNGGLAPRGEEREAVVPANALLYSESPVEVEQRRASADEHVLAVVDDLPGAGVLVGRGASAEVRATFEQSNAVSRIRERTGRRNACNASPDDRYRARFRAHRIAPRRNRRFQKTRKSPRSRMLSRVRTGTETRCVKTSKLRRSIRRNSRW